MNNSEQGKICNYCERLGKCNGHCYGREQELNTSEGQTQGAVGGMKLLIDFIDDFKADKKLKYGIACYMQAELARFGVDISDNVRQKFQDNSAENFVDEVLDDMLNKIPSTPPHAPIKTEGEDENEIHANDTFFYLPTMTAFICVGRDEGKVWYVPDGKMESKWFDKSDCQLIIAPSNHHLSNRKETTPPSPVDIDGCDCVNVEFGSYDNQIEVVPPPHMVEYYTKQGGSKTICLDACVAVEVCNLWKLGITTTGCCCGHNKGEGFIGVIDADIPRMKEMGYLVAFNSSRPGDEDSFIPKSVKYKQPLCIDVEKLAKDYAGKIKDTGMLLKRVIIADAFKAGYAAATEDLGTRLIKAMGQVNDLDLEVERLKASQNEMVDILLNKQSNK